MYSNKYQIRLPFEVLADIREMQEKPEVSKKPKILKKAKTKKSEEIPSETIKEKIDQLLIEADMIAKPFN